MYHIVIVTNNIARKYCGTEENDKTMPDGNKYPV